MTHTLTHTGKGLYGNNGAKSAADLILLEQKWPESLENQGLEGSQSVGKDEVPSSNLGSSSKKKDTLCSVSFFLSAAAQSCIHPSEIPMRGIGLRAVAARMSRDGGRRNAHGSDSLLLLDYIDLMLKLGQADCAVGTVPR